MNEQKQLFLGKNKVALIPNRSRSYGEIVIPEGHFNSSVCMVHAAGPGCRKNIKPETIVFTNGKFKEKEAHVINESNGEFICNSDKIFAVVWKNKVYALGKKVLIKRDTGEQKFGSIIIPEAQRSTDQSLEGEVYSFGIVDKGERYMVRGITIGSRVRLRSWNENMIEVGWQGEYYLVVNEEDIICTI